MLNRPEILAPAGSMEALKAAVCAGADACYVGGSLYSARAFAGNFDTTELLEAIDYCHINNVKLYMAVNTLLKNDEIAKLTEFMEPFYLEGVDGVIVQDMGVIHCLSNAFPTLPLHGSTQMSISSQYGAAFLKRVGLSRFVPARELSLNEIKAIKKEVDIEIETFVHGAMCFSYSGRCLMSSFAGGRSGNRGRCAQPCRKAYSSPSFRHEYALSLKDMCTLKDIPQLIDAGIDSFKIEGRMKKPEYVAAAVQAYSETTQAYLDGCVSEKRIKYHMDRLMDIYNRGGFSSGYYFMQNGKEMLANKRPNHTGTLIGSVESVQAPFVYIKLLQDINCQDVLEICVGGDKGVELTSNVAAKKGQVIRLNANHIKQIQKGRNVYRTRNNALLHEIDANFLKKEKQQDVYGKVTVHIGEPVSLELYSGFQDVSVKVTGEVVSRAKKQPISINQIIDRLLKTGGTGMKLYLEAESDENVFISLGSLNVLRREAIHGLKQKLIDFYKRNPVDVSHHTANKYTASEQSNNEEHADSEENTDSASIYQTGDTQENRRIGCMVSVHTPEQFRIVYNYEFVRQIVIDYNIVKETEIGRLNGSKSIYLALPEIVRENRKQSMKDLMFLAGMFDGIYIKNIDELGLLQEMNYTGTVLLDSSLYAYNDEAVSFYRKILKDSILVGSVELTHQELTKLCCRTVEKLYGYQPVMVTAQCFVNNFKNKCGYSKSELFSFQDEKGNRFYSRNNCADCYSVIYNGVPTDNIDMLTKRENTDITYGYLIDFTIENEMQTKQVMDRLMQAETGGNASVPAENEYTRGHYIKGIE